MHAPREVVRHAGVQHARATRQDVHAVGADHLLASWIVAYRPSSFSFLYHPFHESESALVMLSAAGAKHLLFVLLPFCHERERACHPEPRRGEGPAFLPRRGDEPALSAAKEVLRS